MEKIIHYCWFGSNPIPDRDQKCIDSWKKYLPDYEFICWNETNFNLDEHLFAKQAYEKKKYAFVSDYVRIYALYNYGGIYFDTDYELLEPLEDLIVDKGLILGCENSHFIGTAIMIASSKHWVIKKMLNYYENTQFILDNNYTNEIPNTMLLTDIIEEYGFKRGEPWVYKDIKVYHRNIFFPKKIDDKKFKISGETKGIHYFNGSWWSDKERARSKSKIYNKVFKPSLRKLKEIAINIMGKEKARYFENVIKNKMR